MRRIRPANVRATGPTRTDHSQSLPHARILKSSVHENGPRLYLVGFASTVWGLMHGRFYPTVGALCSPAPACRKIGPPWGPWVPLNMGSTGACPTALPCMCVCMCVWLYVYAHVYIYISTCVRLSLFDMRVYGTRHLRPVYIGPPWDPKPFFPPLSLGIPMDRALCI